MVIMNTRTEIEADIWERASVNREHILAFMRLIPTSDSTALSTAIRQWLQRLHDDPHFSKVSFPQESLSGDLGVHGHGIDRILEDLAGYGRVTHETLIDAPANTMEPLK